MKQVLKAVGLVLLLLTSCSKDDSNPNNGNRNGNGNGNVTPPVEQKAIVITSYSKNYGYAGDSVDILGENFPKSINQRQRQRKHRRVCKRTRATRF